MKIKKEILVEEAERKARNQRKRKRQADAKGRRTPRGGMLDMPLSTHFNNHEFRCRGPERKKNCCSGFPKIKPPLIKALEELRTKLGKSITVISGFRCLGYNRSIGSKDTSQHVLGTAADIRVEGMTPQEVAAVARTIPAFFKGGIGIYTHKNFTHVDVRSRRARWGK